MSPIVLPGSGSGSGSGTSTGDLQLTARGLLAQSGDPSAYGQADAMPTQNIFGCSIGLPIGTTVTGIAMWNSTAAAGTLPTLVRAGIANSSAVMLARSGNVNTLAIWAGGMVQMPLSAPFVTTYTGGYYIVCVQDRTVDWGTTVPTPMRGTAANFATGTVPTKMPAFFVQAGQADLPAVSSPITNVTGTGRCYWMAAY